MEDEAGTELPKNLAALDNAAVSENLEISLLDNVIPLTVRARLHHLAEILPHHLLIQFKVNKN